MWCNLYECGESQNQFGINRKLLKNLEKQNKLGFKQSFRKLKDKPVKKSFKCKYCVKSFSYKSCLNSHEKRHIIDCAEYFRECNANFRNSSKLENIRTNEILTFENSDSQSCMIADFQNQQTQITDQDNLEYNICEKKPSENVSQNCSEKTHDEKILICKYCDKIHNGTEQCIL